MKAIISFIKANKLAVIIIIITIIIAAGIILYFNAQEKNLKPITQSPFPLKMGSRGAEVEVLQSYLNTKGEALIIDGIYGARTDEAVRKHFNNANEISEGNFNEIVLGKK